jgi:hypothetical protein
MEFVCCGSLAVRLIEFRGSRRNGELPKNWKNGSFGHGAVHGGLLGDRSNCLRYLFYGD